MNKEETDYDKENAEDQEFPAHKFSTEGRKKDQVPASNVDCKANNKSQEKWPDRIIAGSSVLLVVVTALYTGFAWKQNELTRKTLDMSREALGVSLEAARLDRRPWVGYIGYSIEASEDAVTWRSGEPRAGERFRIKCMIQNVGKTPAFNLKLMHTVISMGGLPKEPDEWLGLPERKVLFPDDRNSGYVTKGPVLTPQQFLDYSNLRKRVFFRAKLYYCDFAGQRHWTQVEVSHAFGFGDFRDLSSTVGTVPGPTPHPECQN